MFGSPLKFMGLSGKGEERFFVIFPQIHCLQNKDLKVIGQFFYGNKQPPNFNYLQHQKFISYISFGSLWVCS